MRKGRLAAAIPQSRAGWVSDRKAVVMVAVLAAREKTHFVLYRPVAQS
jgi:hypothetical protein